jgi:hypothetical protein
MLWQFRLVVINAVGCGSGQAVDRVDDADVLHSVLPPAFRAVVPPRRTVSGPTGAGCPAPDDQDRCRSRCIAAPTIATRAGGSLAATGRPFATPTTRTRPAPTGSSTSRTHGCAHPSPQPRRGRVGRPAPQPSSRCEESIGVSSDFAGRTKQRDLQLLGQ